MHDQKRAELKLVNQYIIPFSGLKDGDHEFEFDFDQKFFDEYEVLDARNGDISAKLILTKKPTLLTLSIRLQGTLNIQCHRCLDYFDHEIRYHGNLVVKFGDNTDAGTDEIWIIPPGEHQLEMKQYLFECIGLSLPIQRIHPEDEDGKSTCEPEMLKKLEAHSSPHHNEEDVDPRWNELKNLLNDTNNN